MNAPADLLLSDTFSLNDRAVEVFLTPTVIFWEWKSQLASDYREVGDALYRQDHQSITLSEVIGVSDSESTAEEDATDIDDENRCNCKESAQETEIRNSEVRLTFVKRSSSFRWKVKKNIFTACSPDVAQQWILAIRERLAEPHFNRPQYLLVFINPLSGSRTGPSVFSHKVQPLFDIARIRTEVIITERANHARDMLLEMNLSPFSGVLCVGGDGMFSEIAHGLLLRTRRDEGLDDHGPQSIEVRPHLRLGIIPAGSTDTVAYSISGTNDPVTAALHVIIGDSIGLDVMTVHSEERFLRYNFSMLAYGFYGDIVAESESLRWMGPARYDWLGFMKFCRLRHYNGEVSFIEATDPGCHPRDGVFCQSGCSVCSQDDCRSRDPSEMEEEEEENFARSDSREPVWRTFRSPFVALNSLLMSCRCKKAVQGVSRFAHLGNGYADLMVVGDCSRIEYMRHLLRCTELNSDQFDFDFIQIYRVSEFKFTPLPPNYVEELPKPDNDNPRDTCEVVMSNSRQCLEQSHVSAPASSEKVKTDEFPRLPFSRWNCDGEPLEDTAIHCRIHRQLIRLFARGIEENSLAPRRCSLSCTPRNCFGCGRIKRI